MIVRRENSTKKTIMIDARYLNGRASGIGRYTRHLIENLLKLDPDLQLRLITHPDLPRPVEDPRVRSETFPHPPNSLSTRFRLSQSVDFHGVDLFHSPFNILPADLPVPAVFTLHDIMWLLDPAYCTSKLWRRMVTGTFYNAFIPKSVREAAGILTVSNHSREAIADYFPDAALRLDVTYNGLDPFFFPLEPTEGWPLLSRWLAPKTPFVLVVGQGSPYKNHEGALRGFLEAFGDRPDVSCVFVRRLYGRADGELKRLMEDPRLNSRIIQLDYVSSQELRALYSMATAFLFPSLYEGFGLPALEAMACSTAVVTSREGAPAEVCADGALLVDPKNPTEIGAALRRLFDEPELRARIEARGRARAAEFTWEACARRALNFYEQILEG